LLGLQLSLDPRLIYLPVLIQKCPTSQAFSCPYKLLRRRLCYSPENLRCRPARLGIKLESDCPSQCSLSQLTHDASIPNTGSLRTPRWSSTDAPPAFRRTVPAKRRCECLLQATQSIYFPPLKLARHISSLAPPYLNNRQAKLFPIGLPVIRFLCLSKVASKLHKLSPQQMSVTRSPDSKGK
jgi:hypothetical protein